jgi:acetolactate synthase-1/2/3 large subunit
MTGGELVVKCLARHGVEVVFGMPGVHTMAVYDALYEHPQIRHILVRHEESAALMADGYARTTGRVGVSLVTTGPGTTNAATGVAVAHFDSVPVLLISSQINLEAARTRRGLFHEMDQLAFMRPITKWAGRAESAEQIPRVLATALREATTGRPGAAYIEIPLNVLNGPAPDVEPPAMIRPAPPEPRPEDVARAAALLCAAERPVILAGGGVVTAGATAELVALAELLQVPVVTSAMGKGAIPSDHPLSGGGPFTWVTADLQNMDASRNPLPGQADAALAVGYRFSQLSTVNYTLPVPAALVHIDVDPAEIGANYPVQVGMVADAKVALGMLCKAVREAGLTPGQRRCWWEKPPSERPVIDVGPASRPPVDWAELRETLARDAIVAADIVRTGYALVGQFPVYEPRTFLHSASFIAMGHAFPAALGAKAAWPERQVVSVSGDGGFLMTSQELATAVRFGLNVVAIVINDHCLTGIKSMQDAAYGGRHIAVDLHNPDFMQYAAAFGALGLRVQRPEEFAPALRQALEAGRPALVEVVWG